MRFAFLPILGQILLVQRHILPIFNKLVRSAGTKPTSALRRLRLPHRRKARPSTCRAGIGHGGRGLTAGEASDPCFRAGARVACALQTPVARTSRYRLHRRRHPGRRNRDRARPVPRGHCGTIASALAGRTDRNTRRDRVRLIPILVGMTFIQEHTLAWSTRRPCRETVRMQRGDWWVVMDSNHRPAD